MSRTIPVGTGLPGISDSFGGIAAGMDWRTAYEASLSARTMPMNSYARSKIWNLLLNDPLDSLPHTPAQGSVPSPMYDSEFGPDTLKPTTRNSLLDPRGPPVPSMYLPGNEKGWEISAMGPYSYNNYYWLKDYNKILDDAKDMHSVYKGPYAEKPATMPFMDRMKIFFRGY